MIEQIVTLRRKGLSFRKIAKEIDSTVGKVQYAWNKYNKDHQEALGEVAVTKERDVVSIKTYPNKWNRKGFIKVWHISSEKVYLFWRISEEQMMTIKQFEQNDLNTATFALRVYDVTCILFNGHNAHSQFEVILPQTQQHWSISGLKENRCYLVEYGVKLKDDYFVPIMRSEAIHMPRRSVQSSQYSLKQDLFLYGEGAMQKPNWIEHFSTYSYYEDDRKGSK